MRLAKTSILYFISDIGVSVIGFLATLYFARVLGSATLGQYFALLGLIGWAKVPTNGLSGAITKRVSEGKNANEVFSAGTIINGLYGGLLFVVSILGGKYINSYIGIDVNLLFGGLILVNILFTSTVSGLKGKKKVATAGFLRTLDRIFRTAGQVALIYIGYSLLGLLIGHLAAMGVSASIGLILYGFRPKQPSKKSFIDLYDYLKFSWLGQIKGKAFGWMDVIVLQLFVSSGLVGVYGVSWRLASVLVLVSNAVSAVIFPEVSDISVDGKNDRVRNLLNEGLFFAGIFVIPGFFGAIVLGEQILRIYGPEFSEGAGILVVLILARMINVYGSQMLNVINGMDRPDVTFRINSVFVVSNLILNFSLIYLFGWYGAATATATSSLIIAVLGYRSIRNLLGEVVIPLLGVLKQVASAVAMALVITAIKYISPIWNMYVTVGVVFFGAAVYTVSLYGLSARVRNKTHSLVSL